MDGVLPRQVPDLQPERIGSDAGLDRGVESDFAPGAADQCLAGLPLLQHLERVHRPASPYAPTVPSLEPAARGQLVQRPIQARLVVELIGGAMSHDILDPPAATMDRRG